MEYSDCRRDFPEALDQLTRPVQRRLHPTFPHARVVPRARFLLCSPIPQNDATRRVLRSLSDHDELTFGWSVIVLPASTESNGVVLSSPCNAPNADAVQLTFHHRSVFILQCCPHGRGAVAVLSQQQCLQNRGLQPYAKLRLPSPQEVHLLRRAIRLLIRFIGRLERKGKHY